MSGRGEGGRQNSRGAQDLNPPLHGPQKVNLAVEAGIMTNDQAFALK